jgi:large subunit ribosomal protein L23
MRDARQVIVRAIVTEKSSAAQANHNRYTFEVARDASKQEIKHAVERLFNVHVHDVRTASERGKWRRRGVHAGRRPDWKRAVVKLATGETIGTFEGL